MTNPYFAPGNFPFARQESAAFLQTISSIYYEVDQIKEFYQQCGGDLGRLITLGKEPYYIWRDVLQRLSTMGKIEQLCQLFRDSPEAPGLKEVIDAIANAGTPAAEKEPHRVLLESSPPQTMRRFLGRVMDWAKETGCLAIFVSPYAAYDVDRIGDPRRLAQALLQKSLVALRTMMGDSNQAPDERLEGDVLSNLLVATATSFAMSTSHAGLWNRMCDLAAGAADCSRLYPELAGLALRWEDAVKSRTILVNEPSEAGPARWRGLIFVTFEINSCLERELADAGVNFGVLNVLAEGQFSYLRPIGGKNPDGTPRLEPVPPAASIRPRAGKTADLQLEHPVVVVKLMGLAQLRNLRPPLGLEIVTQIRGTDNLPAILRTHLQRSPFVMLGGGLLDPFVALAFEAHFKNTVANPVNGEVPRWVVLHPSPPDDDKLRVAECLINSLDDEWTHRSYGLDLLVHDLPDIISRMGDQIPLGANQASSAA